jgi:hypothetical protein
MKPLRKNTNAKCAKAQRRKRISSKEGRKAGEK